MKKVVSLFLSILMLANVIICVDLTAYADSVNPSESKQYQMFKADYYSNNFNFDTPSFAKEYYDDMKNDTAFMSFLATWEVGHIATSPSHAMESGMITLKEYYKAVLFDLFAESNSETGLTDQLLKMVKNSELSYIVSVTKTVSKPLSEISQDNISYEGLSKISAQDAADAIKKSGLYQGTEMYGIVTKIAGWAKDAKSLVEAFSKYLAIADLNDGTKEILNIIANDSQNPNELREAAADCVSYFGEGYEKVLNQILAGTWDITVGVFDTVADVALDWAWGMIIGSITTATGGAIGSAVLLGAKGIRVFSNFLFKVDKDVESFYQIKAAVVCEDALKRVIANINNQGYLSSSFELSNLYNQSVEAFEKTVLLGFDYSIGLLKNSAEAPAIKYTNLLFGKYDECMDLISQISGFKNDKIQIFSKFEDKCLNAFKKEYCLDFDDVIYGLEHQNIPIDAIELTQLKDFTAGLTNECMFNYIKAEFLPEAHTEIAFESWRSSDNSVIEIVNDTSFTVHKEGSCTLTCYLSSGVSADITVTVGEQQGDYEYDYNHFKLKFYDSSLTAIITDYTGSASRLAIPSKIGKYIITDIGKFAFRSCNSLTSVTIPNSVKHIDFCAFTNCKSLESVTIPGSASIGYHAFRDCTSLTSVTICNGVISIGRYAFAGCTSLTSVTIPDSVGSIEDSVFEGCTSLQNVYVDSGNKYYCDIDGVVFNKNATQFVCYPGGKKGDYTIPNSVTSIGSCAFSDCTSLTGVTIPNSVTSIGRYAFDGCKSLTSVIIPDSVKSICDGAFSGCTSLTSVTIPDSVASIEDSVFEGCTSLENITIANSVTNIGGWAFENTSYYNNTSNWENSVLYIDNCLIEAKDTISGDYSIKPATRVIADFAFRDCTSLTSVTIPNSVTSIGSCAFSDCTSLTGVTIPNSVTSIGRYAFDGCKSLTSVIIPDSVTSIDEWAFNGCTSLTSVTIPDSVTSIDSYTFGDCTALESVTIPNSVTSIAYYAFSGCDNLTIYGLKDSHAENYAENMNINFVAICCIDAIYDDGVVTTAPTCTQSGIKTYTCKVCGYEKTETVSAVGHNYTTQVTEPTCTTQGYTKYTCSNCGDSYVSDYIKPSHNYVNGICTVCGYYNSITCGNTLDIDIANAGDIIYVYFTPDVDDSYIFYSTSDYDTYVTLYDENMNRLTSDDESGNNNNFSLYYNFESEKTYIFACKMWSSSATGSFQVTLEQHEHLYSSEIVEPACTSWGYTLYTCSCGDSFSVDDVSPLGHNFVNGVCERCNLAYPELIEVQENEIYNVSFDTSGKSSYYSFTPRKNLDYFIQSNNLLNYVPNCSIRVYDRDLNFIESTYFSNEILWYLNSLEEGKIYIIQFSTYLSFENSGDFQFSINQHEHSYSSEIVEPTCTARGYTRYTCSCGDSFTADYVDALGHNFVDDVCVTCGVKHIAMDIFLNSTYDIEITEGGQVYYLYFTPEADGSYMFYSIGNLDTYVTLYDENMNGLKSDDDSGNDSNFLISYDFEAGKTYIFACKMWSSSATGSFQVTLEEHEHSYSSEIVEPTCTSRGYTRCTCSCGDSFTTDYVDVLGHNYVDGTCTRCGKVESDFEFELLDDETIRITEYTGTETDVTVPSSIGEYIVKEVSYSAFDDCDLIQSITFSEGIERIYCICTNCSNLDTINLPSTVNELEESSFANPSNIETVIGNGNNNEDYIIEGMSGNLKNINVSPENPYYCSIDGVLFTKNVDELLRYPSGKETTIYEIPDTVKTFSSLAFAFCGNIEKLIIPASVETIDNQMFALFKYVKMDGYQSISELNSDFKGFEVSSDNANYCSVDGVLYTKDMNTLIAYPNGKIDNNFVTDNRVNKIGSMAFTYTLVGNVQLNNVKRIEDQAFFQSGFLKSVKISENCNYIGNMSFAYCSKLENIVISDRTTIADEGVFGCCVNLNKVVLPSSIQKIPQMMFIYCMNLSEIYIPKSVISVDMSAFATSEKLQTVYYEGTEEEWNKINVEEHNEPLLNATVIFNSNPEMIGIGNIDADTLTAAIEKFSEFNSADYSESSYNNLKDIVNRNKELVDTAQSQEEIDFAVTEILEAIYDLQPYLNLTVSAENGSYEVTCDGNASSDNKYSLLFGTEITLSATANEGYEFVGWYDITNNLYFSKESTYTFKLTENTNLKAVFVKEQSATLTFTTYSNWVQSTVTKTIDEWNSITSIEDLLPQVPYKYGYSNGRWVYDNDDILSKLRAGESVFLIPEYDEDNTSLPTPREPENGVPALDLYYKLDADANVGSFVMAAGIPDDCQIESVGVAFYYKKANDFDPTNFELLINNKMLVSRFNTEEIEDIYIVNMNKLTSTYNWAVRGYVTYYDADGNLKTAYSNQVNIVNREQV